MEPAMQNSKAPDMCRLCPRLVNFRDQADKKNPHWHNGPVEPFGQEDAKLAIIGMAPGMGGANRTGRPFTGDHAGDLLFATLEKAGLTRGTYARRADDGLELVETIIVNVVRCVPPQNKPVASEVKNCRSFLLETIGKLPRNCTYFALGRIAHDAFLTAMGLRRADFAFAHGARHQIGRESVLIDSYHCSRYNTNTGRLTTAMFENALFMAAQNARIGNWKN